jgi:hypothetical protein
MVNKKGSTPKQAKSCSRMYPSLHKDVSSAVSDHITLLRFHENDSDEGVSNEYSTYVIGVFRCCNPLCPTAGWSSGKVTILIRKYHDNGYNAVVFKQRCKSCNRLGTLNLDQKTYTDRVAYRLMKWAGVALVQPYYKPKESPPHKSHLCEGCKRGICPGMDEWKYR